MRSCPIETALRDCNLPSEEMAGFRPLVAQSLFKSCSYTHVTLILKQQVFGRAAESGHGGNEPRWSEHRLDPAGLPNPTFHR